MKAHSVPILLVVGCTTYGAIHYLQVYLRLRERPAYFWFATSCISVALYCAATALLYSSDEFGLSIWCQRAQFSSLSLFACSLFLFLYALHPRRLPLLAWALPLSWAPWLVLSWIDSRLILNLSRKVLKQFSLFGMQITYREIAPGPLLDLFYASLAAGVLFVWVELWRARRRSPDSNSARLFFALSAFCLASFNDILLGAGLIRSIYCVEYSFLLLLWTMDRGLICQFVELYQKERNIHTELEMQVAARTHEIADLVSQLSEKNAELQEANLQLRDLADHDNLTGLLRRDAFLERLKATLHMAQRRQFALSVAMIDLDHFKQHNDTYGHLVGDRILRQVADVLSGNLRERRSQPANSEAPISPPSLRRYDFIARYGGDEFVAALPFCDARGAEIVMRRIVERVSAIDFGEGPGSRVTLSIGVTAIERPSDCRNVEDIIRQADANLYQAKQAGRARHVITVYTAELHDG